MLDKDRWYHMVCIGTESKREVYVDGKSVDESCYGKYSIKTPPGGIWIKWNLDKRVD